VLSFQYLACEPQPHPKPSQHRSVRVLPVLVPEAEATIAVSRGLEERCDFKVCDPKVWAFDVVHGISFLFLVISLTKRSSGSFLSQSSCDTKWLDPRLKITSLNRQHQQSPQPRRSPSFTEAFYFHVRGINPKILSLCCPLSCHPSIRVEAKCPHHPNPSSQDPRAFASPLWLHLFKQHFESTAVLSLSHEGTVS
jgi:hypothetical protein